MQWKPLLMVDIHSHILWGLDDGAESRDASLAMLRLAAETGTTDIVATPHANNEYTYDPDKIREKIKNLQVHCGAVPKIHPGCDFHLSFGNIENALQNPAPYTINARSYLMVELPEHVMPPNMGRAFEHMIAVGIIPVITHPERNRVLWTEERQFNAWLEHGCYAQVTAQSLEGHFGRKAKEIAWKLVQDGRAQFVASDGHDLVHRPPRLDRAFALVSQKHGHATAQRLFTDNPRHALEGSRITETPRPEKTKFRFPFFR
jgi:protein-tyrosine phosphatase